MTHRLDTFTHDLLLEVMLTADRQWWLRRAQDFERAKPTAADFRGRQTIEDTRQQWRRLDQMARACRARAEVSDPIARSAEVADVLAEAA